MKKHTKFKGFAAGVVVAVVSGLFSLQASAADYMLCSTKDKALRVGGTENPVYCEMKYNRGDITASIVKPLSELHSEGWRVVGVTQGSSYTVMFLLINDSSKQ